MKKMILMLSIFAGVVNVAKTQTNKQFLDYFPTISKDSVVNTITIVNLDYDILEKNRFPDSIALRRFFDNNIDNMQAVEYGYNPDTQEDFVTPYIKRVYPIYKIKYNNTHLVCYIIESVIYLTQYNSLQDKFQASLIIADYSDDFGNVYTHSIVYPNNYIAMIQVNKKSYYILSKIDFEYRKFIELKRIDFDGTIEDHEIRHNVFNALGISEEGELLEENENSQETENKIIEK
jgi:hypothetical protein